MQLRTGDPWGRFKASLDPLLVSLKREPDRAGEVSAAVQNLISSIYNDNFLHGGRLGHAEIRDFLIPKGRRIGSLLPPTPDGRQLMELIVTVLTMTSASAAEQTFYNQWADEAFAAAVGRAEQEAAQ
jgi:hypothetical protein